MDHAVRMLLSMILIFLRVLEALLGLPVVRDLVGVLEGLGSRVLDLGEKTGWLM